MDETSDMFYVNIRELLALSIHFQTADHFNRFVTTAPAEPPEPSSHC